MDHIEADASAGRHAKQVYPSHVAKPILADVINMIIFDDVPVRFAFLVAPDPTYGDSGLIQIVHAVAQNPVPGRLAYQDTRAGMENSAAISDLTVADQISTAAVPYFDTPCPQILENATLHPVIA